MFYRTFSRVIPLIWIILWPLLGTAADIPCPTQLGEFGKLLKPMVHLPLQIREADLAAMRTAAKGSQFHPPTSLGPMHRRVFRSVIFTQPGREVWVRLVFDQNHVFVYYHQKTAVHSPAKLAKMFFLPKTTKINESTVSRIVYLNKDGRNRFLFAVATEDKVALYDIDNSTVFQTFSTHGGDPVLSIELNPHELIVGTNSKLLWFDLRKPSIPDRGPDYSFDLPGPARHIEQGFFETGRSPSQTEVSLPPEEPWQEIETAMAPSIKIDAKPTVIIVSDHQLLTYGRLETGNVITFAPTELSAPVVAIRAVSTQTPQGVQTLIYMRTQQDGKSKIKIINDARDSLTPHVPARPVDVRTLPPIQAFPHFMLFSYANSMGSAMGIAVTESQFEHGFLFAISPDGHIGRRLAPEDIQAIESLFPIKNLDTIRP